MQVSDFLVYDFRTTMDQVDLAVTTELWLGDKTTVGHHGKVADAELHITSGIVTLSLALIVK